MSTKKGRPSKSFILLIVLLLILSSSVMIAVFVNSQRPISYGIIQGQVTVGPLCSLEPCDKSQNLTGYHLAFTNNGRTYYYAPLSANGNFSIKLEVGSYVVIMEPSCQWLGCNQVFPKNLDVLTNETIVLNISIDTGIR
jgi:hypothetical protein